MEDLISISDAARLLDRTSDAVYKLIKHGKIQAVGTRRLMRVSRTQVLAWKNRGANLQEIMSNPERYQITPSVEEKQKIYERLIDEEYEAKERILVAREAAREKLLEAKYQAKRELYASLA